MKSFAWTAVLLLASCGGLGLLRAQSPPARQTLAVAPAGAVERIQVHGKFLEGNLEGDSPDREVLVYLPPSYSHDRHRRYPVVYFLHGYDDNAEACYGAAEHFIHLPAILDKAFAEAGNREMILVTPNAFTRYQGSFYSNSVTTGNWEDYIAHELVAYMDTHYRTIPERAARGLSGHSLGGYGALRIGMRHPEVFSSIYLLSACCLDLADSFLMENGPKAETAKTPDEEKALNWRSRVIFAASAAWSPNPQNPPFFADLPVKDGKLVAEVAAKFHANEPLYMLDQYIHGLRRLKSVGFDVGDKDTLLLPAAQHLDSVLAGYGIAHQFATYEGDHINHVADRIQTKLVPFFSQNLSFAEASR